MRKKAWLSELIVMGPCHFAMSWIEIRKSFRNAAKGGELNVGREL